MLRRLVQLEPGERVMLAAGVAWVLAARGSLWVRGGSLRGAERLLDQMADKAPRLDGRRYTHELAAWGVSAAARRVPGTVCLGWALALRGLLAQLGLPASLRLGVAHDDAPGLRAHAWVECQGRTFSFGDDIEGYSELRGRSSP
jgi:hypothetical protein